MQLRMSLIEELTEQLATWYPLYGEQISRIDIEGIKDMRSALQTTIADINKKKETYKSNTTELFSPIKDAYLEALRGKSDPVSVEQKEFIMLWNQVNSKTILSRLQKEDTTLKKYERFVNYTDNYNAIVSEWARTEGGYADSDFDAITYYDNKIMLLSTQHTELERFVGELRRLQTQMQIAAGYYWLAHNNQGPALEDLKQFIECEQEAVSIP